VVRQAEAGRFAPVLFQYFRNSRRGEKGFEDVGNDVCEKLITSRVLLGKDWYPDSRVHSAAGAYQWLVREEFKGLQSKYPPGSAFDDLFVEEARATGYLDPFYWYGQGMDYKYKVVRLAAELLLTREAPPVGYDGRKPLCASRDEYLLWL
jgi:hypothetical protein